MLRPYQESLIEQLRVKIQEGKTRLIAVLPTGGGKTFTFCHIVQSAVDRGRKCLILTDRIELMKQADGALQHFNLLPILIKAGAKPYLGGVLYTAMVETLARRLKHKDYQHFLKTIDLIIIDECHMRAFDKIFPYFREDARVLGFTATPKRMGKETPLVDFYDDICVGVEIEYLVENGFLAKPEYYGVEADLSGIRKVQGDFDVNQVAKRFSETQLFRGVVENWMNITPFTKTLVFSANIASSKELVQEFQAAGVQARHLDSKMKKSDREEVIAWFHNNSRAVLCNVGILTKGFDEPSIQTVVLYRPTTSIPLYLQMVGRGSRIHKPSGKTTFTILDFGENIARLGYWHQLRHWTLKRSKDKGSKKDAAVLKKCEECEAFIPAQQVTCQYCGHVHQAKKKELEFAQLQKLSGHDRWRQIRDRSLADKAAMAKAKLVKPYRIMHEVKTFEEAEEFARLMGWSPRWFDYNHDRFWWSELYLKKRNSGRVAIKVS
jgi:superfamily II DNA or RNA helicase